uniref:RRM domain-containing protein n=1 Tax=Timema douglasi TaxID=61478 RepID=A0A7R8VS17_TIMDO|nr:unnamed protein product [Timema douglasi]
MASLVLTDSSQLTSDTEHLGFGERGDMIVQEDTVFVSGMSPHMTEEDIAQHFGSIGVIKTDRRTMKPKIWMYKDKLSGKPKGEATVTYDDSNAAKSAIDWFDGQWPGDGNIFVALK